MMAVNSNYSIRRSGRNPGSCYIDSSGHYRVSEIAKISGIPLPDLEQLYRTYSSEYSDSLDVYYFNSETAAENLIGEILQRSGQNENGRLIFLTEKEVEYLRKALINEGSNTIHIKENIKDSIFKKLNY